MVDLFTSLRIGPRTPRPGPSRTPISPRLSHFRRLLRLHTPPVPTAPKEMGEKNEEMRLLWRDGVCWNVAFFYYYFEVSEKDSSERWDSLSITRTCRCVAVVSGQFTRIREKAMVRLESDPQNN